ncbi:NIF3-like protein 1 [Hypomesus transpacificus]|uniref:NIF3-like protein 1 n=1 Tax=Hypomesus transpacificus TaxID=137520 RepID=UPI001F07C150|nr:NIF3-like protein 1 [Hypomesus transpacificus]XP_046906712.1 NIF3-like protein 1 [Hypomesus transpacificus]XP_046906713.1 NIF3-like protein 1 [Hypomesus transpacificus]
MLCRSAALRALPLTCCRRCYRNTLLFPPLTCFSPPFTSSLSPSLSSSLSNTSSCRTPLSPPHPPLISPPSISRSFSHSPRPTGPMDLQEVLKVLEQLAPLSLAESWDNVGLLVQPSKARPIRTILLTNDLTEPVMEEAEAMKCDLIVSYHPPLFRPIKRLVQGDWKQRLAVRAVEAGMAVFSPHTSWDSVDGGVNDWLVGGLGSGRVSVLSQALASAPQRHRLEFEASSEEELRALMSELKQGEKGALLQHSVTSLETGGYRVCLSCPDSELPPAVQTLLRHPGPNQSLSILQTQKPPLPGRGAGRLCVLDQPVTVATAVQKMKVHLGLSHLRLALGAQRHLESMVSTAAVCAGSGASVLDGIRADLYITGEMSHHEVLDAVAKGTCVILSDHSNSERGFLAVFKERLAVCLPDSVNVVTSRADRDPLEVV